MSLYQKYAKLGWPVFPIAGPAYAKNPDLYETWKVPLVRWQKYQTELPKESDFALWLKQWPLAWVGCSTGPFANLFVIDIDGDKGKESLASLEIPMPVTRIAKTQRGVHYFFKWSAKLNAYVTTVAGIKPGIDFRGQGGFIILPSPESKREWISEEAPAELPEVWFAHLKRSLDKNWRLGAMQELALGNRHDTFVRLAGSLLNAKWSGPEILSVLRPMAQECGFGEDIGALVEDIVWRYSPQTVLSADQEKRLRDLEAKRFEEMKNHTRQWMAKMPLFSSTIMKLYAAKIETLFSKMDAYDKTAIEWTKMDQPWLESNACLVSQKILSVAHEICR